MVGVNSVVMVCFILSSCGVQAPLLLCCEVHLYYQQTGSSLCVMSSVLLSSCNEGLLWIYEAVFSLVGDLVAAWWRFSLPFALGVPQTFGGVYLL